MPLRLRSVLGLCLTSALAAFAQSPSAPHWISTWTAAPDSPGPALKAQTLRHVVRVSAGGEAVRVRLSNRFGTGPVTFGPVHVARHGAGSEILPGSDRALTFEGRPTVTIPKGGSALSDSAELDVAPLQELAVSFHLPAGAAVSTVHSVGMQTVYFAGPGDATGAKAFPAGETDDSRYFLTDVEVRTARPTPVWVAVGDSVTDGVGSRLDGNGRWPDALADRLQGAIAVVNAGIAGNRILRDGVDPFLGPSSLARFEADVLSKPGVRGVLLLQGINDITANTVLPAPEEHVTSDQIIAGLQTLIARAHDRGLKIWGATLLPRGGAQGSRPHTPQAEVLRLAVNAWIRSSHAFDGVLEFEQALRDPAHPDRLLPAYDSGDHTHPNDAGFKVMAALVDLRELK
ncbi:MAG TPA: SGNH/GDSL hydrolase family protein [Holophagaceae bacterium]|nr:SGNH/GDSL hydrolase family protein [Holophagaceae bacterium]